MSFNQKDDIDRFVGPMMPDDETVQQWEEAFITILFKLQENHFSEDDTVIDSVVATLRGLAALPSAAGRANTCKPSTEMDFATAQD